MIRGERLIKVRDSWFFAKFIEVKPYIEFLRVEYDNIWGDLKVLPVLLNLQILNLISKYKSQKRSAKVPFREGNSPNY